MMFERRLLAEIVPPERRGNTTLDESRRILLPPGIPEAVICADGGLWCFEGGLCLGVNYDPPQWFVTVYDPHTRVCAAEGCDRTFKTNGSQELCQNRDCQSRRFSQRMLAGAAS